MSDLQQQQATSSSKRQQQQLNKPKGDKLINEAIKRILLDIVVRGHGDRLIGRWSREPELEHFLEQVPYMLDRINQLHLACTRSESLEQNHLHHYHHHHHHHNVHDRSSSLPLSQSSLHDFVNLIGDDHHWLVRTRDTLGLTPLHKAVLFNNRPIVEYILDRYPDEIAAQSTSRNAIDKLSRKVNSRLIDGQDKYGRTALHYAASKQTEADTQTSGLYKFLLAKGASAEVRDFRGKSPVHYLRHPQQLRAKSIIHLANKLNSNYQANVLSKTLRATIDRRPLDRPTNDTSLDGDSSVPELSEIIMDRDGSPEQNRESMSISCGDLRAAEMQNSSKMIKTNSQSSITNSTDPSQSSNKLLVAVYDDEKLNCGGVDDKRSETSIESLCSDQVIIANGSNTLKQLKADRCAKLHLDPRTKLEIVRCLSEGKVDKVNEFLIEGYGEFLIHEAPVACWNQYCRRYIGRIAPDLLQKLDQLHESIASNDIAKVRHFLNEEPILARIKRPYNRASLSSIHLSVYLGRKTIMKHIVERFPELINQRDSQGATCLHWAAKSLKNDRLYCWLLEHFGPQLEHLRDSKNRTAADYRQQAIRHSSFELCNVSTPLDACRLQQQKHPISAQSLLKQSQQQSNKLSIGGQKSQLFSTRNKPNKPSNSKDFQTTNTSESKSAHLGEIQDRKLNEPKAIVNEVPEKSESEQIERRTSIVKPRQVHSARSSSRTEQISPISRRFSDTSPQHLIAHHTQDIRAANDDEIPLTKFIESPEYQAQKLLGQMVQLDCNNDTVEEKTGEVHRITDSVKTDEEKARVDSLQSNEPNQRPLSATSLRKLDSTILGCISSGDVKKLEHIILAGFGQSVVKVSETIKRSQSSNLQLSDEMKNFLDNRLSDYMTNMKTIHQVLHQCFAFSDSTNVDLNESFHKLCNLMMSDANLIMCRDEFGASPLHVAILRCDKRLIDYLLRRHPEASSGPDYDNRNALHYAAIVLASIRNHSSTILRLTTLGNVDAYWQVQESTISEIYSSLCSRYSDLLSFKDKFGHTSSDYLEMDDRLMHKIELEDPSQKLLSPQQLLSSCCPEYAKLLHKYNYLIMNPSFASAEPRQESMIGFDDDGGSRSEQTHSEPNTVTRSYNRRSFKRQNRSQDDPKYLMQQENALTTQLDGELIVPASSLPLDAVYVRQMAPKPTVGSELGFPLVAAQSPTLDSNRKLNKLSPAGSAKSSASSAKRKNNDLLDNLNIGRANNFIVGMESPSSASSNLNRRHSHLRKPITQGPGKNGASVVGGVIVPTIIHNDKMDEIETYDIIYRQPPPNQQQSVIQPTPESDLDEELALTSRSESRQSHHSNGTPNKCFDTSGLGENTSDDGSSDSSDDEERVERLSNEFEDRVRREKSELRAKVDQIMNEIKMSAKSGKSSRFLMSPTPNSNRDRNNQPDSGSNNSTTLFVQDTKNGLPNERKQRFSISSSGQSSSCSTASSTNGSSASSKSVTGSCSSQTATSCSSSCSSSMNSLAKQQNNKKLEAPTKLTNSVGDLAGQLVSKNTYGQTYLHFIASRAQCASTLYKVLDHGSHLIGERDIFYRTARDVAVQFNLPQNVQVLDKFIIDLFIGNNTSLLRHLLNQGYSPLIHVSDSDGNDIMLILKLLKLDRMIHFLLQMADFQRWRDELHTFIRHGYSAGVTELIKKHKDLIKAKSVHARTSLHLAVLFDRLDMVNELVEADPLSVHCTDNMGRTALHYTYGLHLKNVEEIREKLLVGGASLEARDVKMRTPKYYYIFKREIEEIKRIELEFN